MTTTVKHFHSAMSGAPTLNGVAGSLIAVLDACLVDGFGLKSADSVVVSGGIATATFSTGHSFEPDVIALVSGATPAGLNGEKRVLSTTTNAITFDATGITDQTATGAVTVKIAPAGWQKAFSGTNLAVYRSLDPTGTRMFLRVNDADTTNARVIGYESMSDVSTGVRPFPTDAQVSGGGYWPKANAANATARAWTVIADSRGWWLHTHTSTTNPGISGGVWGFGDYDSLKSGDPFACALQCSMTDTSASTAVNQAAAEYAGLSAVAGPFTPRSFTGLGGSAQLDHAQESHGTAAGGSGANASGMVPTYPNGPNNGLILSRKLLVERGVALRGGSRGLLLAAQNCHAAFNWRDKVAGQGQYAGRTLMAVKCGSPAGTTSQGVVFFDITGPWG